MDEFTYAESRALVTACLRRMDDLRRAEAPEDLRTLEVAYKKILEFGYVSKAVSAGATAFAQGRQL